MAKYVYGIDLGTTYSCIAYVDDTGRATVIDNMDGESTTPSVVNFASPTDVVVGQVAKENAVIEPDKTVALVKTLMGKSDFAIHYDGKDRTPEEVSAYILKKLVGDAEKMLGEEVKDVVITCPAYFGTAERTATKNAGAIAGLNVLEIISEPTAAALFYGCTKTQEDKTILVYDLGGGTFDVTIMRITPEEITVVCSDGKHQLGGKDWDEKVMEYLATEFCAQTGYDGDFDENAQQGLRLKAEKAKQQLTARPEVPVMLDVAGFVARINLPREMFDSLTKTLLDETIGKTEEAVKVAATKGFTIDEILLVGGSTRMPQVAKALEEKFKLAPKILDPDEAVAKGAAIHAAIVAAAGPQLPGESGGEPSPPPIALPGGGKPPTLVLATTKSFAVEVIRNGENVCFNMIIKNTSLVDNEITASAQFGTHQDGQTSIAVIVYENDASEKYFAIDPALVLGEAILELPAPMPAGSPIEVTLILNGEGMLDVTGRDVTSGKTVNVQMKASGIMEQKEVEDLTKRAGGIVVT